MKAEEKNIQNEMEELSNEMMDQLFGGACGNEDLEIDLPILLDCFK